MGVTPILCPKCGAPMFVKIRRTRIHPAYWSDTFSLIWFEHGRSDEVKHLACIQCHFEADVAASKDLPRGGSDELEGD